jgi:hypothetical protein
VLHIHTHTKRNATHIQKIFFRGINSQNMESKNKTWIEKKYSLTFLQQRKQQQQQQKCERQITLENRG